MKYYVRARGADEISGPYTVQELESLLAEGKLTATHLVLADTGQNRDQLKNYWDNHWIPLSSVEGMAGHTPAILNAPTNALTDQELREEVNKDMLLGGLVCLVGILITGATFLSASSRGGGTYVVAWGAIAFGGIRFFRGLMAR